MPITYSAPVVKHFHLEKSDAHFGIPETEKTLISVREATQGDQDIRSDLLTMNFEYTSTGNKATQRVSWVAIHRKEVFLTLASCNITKDKEGTKPLFTFVDGRLKDEKAFEIAWASLAPIVANEIWEKVIEANPQWSMTEGES